MIEAPLLNGQCLQSTTEQAGMNQQQSQCCNNDDATRDDNDSSSGNEMMKMAMEPMKGKDGSNGQEMTMLAK